MRIAAASRRENAYSIVISSVDKAKIPSAKKRRLARGMSDLARKTILGFAQLIVGLSALLFVPAWTFDFWQAWVYLFVFATSSALITAYLWKKDLKLLARRVNAGPAAEKEKSQRLIQSFASLAFIALLILPSLDHRHAWSNVPLPIVLIGNICVALGFLIIFRVFKENTFTAATIEVVADQKVIATGPYAIVRHPMYSGGLVLLLGTPLALGSWWGLLMFIPMTAIIVWRLLDEEKLLANNLLGYREYCRKVRYRLVPLLW
jgi:protein-S-isoprenylcysteine O-methyltransferase Ste14